MRKYSGCACLEHSDLFKVKNRRDLTSQLTSEANGYSKRIYLRLRAFQLQQL